jgi:hypothetical protein
VERDGGRRRRIGLARQSHHAVGYPDQVSHVRRKLQPRAGLFRC